MSSIEVVKYLYAEKGGKEGLKKATLETLMLVHAQTVALCPTDKGQLRNSYMIVFDNKEDLFNTSGGVSAPADQKISLKSSETVGYVGTNSDHWYPEFGTRYQIAQPHLRPAARIARGASAKSVMAAYCREKMQKEFMQRRYEYIFKEIK